MITRKYILKTLATLTAILAICSCFVAIFTSGNAITLFIIATVIAFIITAAYGAISLGL